MKQISFSSLILPMVVVLVLTACSGQDTTLQTEQPGTTNSPSSVTATLAPANPTGGAETQALPTQSADAPAATAAPQDGASDGFNVVLDTPEEVTVAQPEYVVSGRAPIETVVTVNDEIVLVGADETFSVQVALEEGPNLIEVIASNPEGQESEFNLIVTYQPAS